MTTIYYDHDADLSLIQSRHIALIGYGNQGHAHAQNLRDSGCEVRVGAVEGSRSWRAAETDHFAVQSVADVCAWADLISVLLPDQIHKTIFEQSIRPALTQDITPAGPVKGRSIVTPLLMMAHGFSIHFGQVQPPEGVDVAMVAPVGPGHMMSRLYRQGFGIPALMAVEQDVSGGAEQLALSYAAALGCCRAGVTRTTFQEETETDLFGEQAVLCGGHWMEEWEAGAPLLKQVRAQERDGQLEMTGARLRAMMSRDGGEEESYAEHPNPLAPRNT